MSRPFLHLIGCTPRARKAEVRRQQIEREKRLERITRNIEAWEWQRERSRQNQASDLRIDRYEADARAAEAKLNKIVESAGARSEALTMFESGDLKGDVMQFLQEAGLSATDLFADGPPERGTVPNESIAPKKKPGIETLRTVVEELSRGHEIGVDTIFESAAAAIRAGKVRR